MHLWFCHVNRIKSQVRVRFYITTVCDSDLVFQPFGCKPELVKNILTVITVSVYGYVELVI